MIGSKSFYWLLCFCLFGFSQTSMATEEKKSINVINEIQQCRQVSLSTERLNCFDELAKRFAPPFMKGKNGAVSPVFEVDSPQLLRYRSYGVIFVLYLRDAEGNVLQNLHLGGTGEDQYLIEHAGQYTLKIDGSDRWEIWLEEAAEETVPAMMP